MRLVAGAALLAAAFFALVWAFAAVVVLLGGAP